MVEVVFIFTCFQVFFRGYIKIYKSVLMFRHIGRCYARPDALLSKKKGVLCRCLTYIHIEIVTALVETKAVTISRPSKNSLLNEKKGYKEGVYTLVSEGSQ